MSLIQQFLTENLTRDLNHQLLAQIQDQNSAVETLVSNLQSLRDKQNLYLIENKIKRVEQFIQLKRQVMTTLQPLNTNTSAIFQWVLNNLVENSFLYELIKRQQFFVQKQLIEIAKKVLLQNNYLQQHHEDTEFVNKIVGQLHGLSQERGHSIKNVNREKIKEIDYRMQLLEQKIRAFEERVCKFNTEMMLFLRKINSFEQKIRNQFYQQFKSQSFRPQTPVSNRQVKKGLTRQNSEKSHISIDSHKNRQSQVKLVRPQQFYESQKTPRKCLQTQAIQVPEQRAKGYQRKSIIQKKRLTLDDRRSSQVNEMKSSIQQNRAGTLENKRASMDYQKKGPSDKYSDKYKTSQLQEELKSMNKTLSTLNYFNRPQSSNMMYTMSNFGHQVRLPTKWASNSRSSISYYPPR